MTEMYHRKLAFVDTETTGLDPKRHEIIQFAAIIREPRGEILRRPAFRIKPERIEDADPDALRINRYNPEHYYDAISQFEAASRISALLHDCVIIGHNVSFDHGFLHTLIQRFSPEEAKSFPYHKIDTVTLAYEHLVPCGLEKLSLANVCDFLGISNRGAHSAEADVQRCMEVYDELVQAPHWKRAYWTWKARKRSWAKAIQEEISALAKPR